MITLRNRTKHQAMAVRSDEALEVGMLVKVVQGAAAGSPPSVVAADATDAADVTIMKGIVFYVDKEDDEHTDGSLALTTLDLTFTNLAIPSGVQCLMVWDKPTIGYHQAAADVSYDISAAREADKVAFLGATSKLVAYNGGGVDGSENFMGTVTSQDGAEITVILTGL